MVGGIRALLLGLILVTVIPFTALIGAGLWTQWKLDQAAALKSALGEARQIAMHIDDEMGNFTHLLTGLSWAVSVDPADTVKNDALLHRVKAQLPGYVSNILVTSLDGNNIGTSSGRTNPGRTFIGDRDFFQAIRSGKRFAVGLPVRGRTSGQWISSIAHGINDE